MTQSEITNIAAGLLQQRGLGPVTHLEPLIGGRNNRAFRVVEPNGHWLLKQYFQDTSGGRDRCGSEWAWSSFCWKHGVTWVPEPVAHSQDHHANLFEFVEGRQLIPGEVNESHVRQAAAFVASVNRLKNQPDAITLPIAAEACFSMEEHLTCVDRRTRRLGALPVRDDLDEALQSWLRTSLVPGWQLIAERLRAGTTSEDRDCQLPLEFRCLSPSDFGFHNALMTSDGRIRFLDFEYAGWDDPAKLICDFYWQHDRPVPRSTKPIMLAAFSGDEAISELEMRAEKLMPVYGVKWCCLLLNEFVAEDRRRRDFALTTSVSNDCRQEQLERAKGLLIQALAAKMF